MLRSLLIIALLASPALAQQREYIRTPQGTTLGWTASQGARTEVYARDGTRLGYYDARTNATYDRTGRRIAQGNVLAALVYRR